MTQMGPPILLLYMSYYRSIKDMYASHDNEDELEQFRAHNASPLELLKTSEPLRKKKLKHKEPFLSGPIPLSWLQRAGQIQRKSALLVGLTLWYLAGMEKRRTQLTLSAKRCELLGLGKRGVRNGLADLQNAGLIRFKKNRGTSARVELIVVEAGAKNGFWPFAW